MRKSDTDSFLCHTDTARNSVTHHDNLVGVWVKRFHLRIGVSAFSCWNVFVALAGVVSSLLGEIQLLIVMPLFFSLKWTTRQWAYVILRQWSATINAAQITLLIAIEDPLHLKPRLQTNIQHDFKLQNKKTVRYFKSRENAKRVLFFYSLARIDRTEEIQRALHEKNADTPHPFL